MAGSSLIARMSLSAVLIGQVQIDDGRGVGCPRRFAGAQQLERRGTPSAAESAWIPHAASRLQRLARSVALSSTTSSRSRSSPARASAAALA